jgi:hypothetical protein
MTTKKTSKLKKAISSKRATSSSGSLREKLANSRILALLNRSHSSPSLSLFLFLKEELKQENKIILIF